MYFAVVYFEFMLALPSEPNDLSTEELKNLSALGGKGHKSLVSTNTKTYVDFRIYLAFLFCLFFS